MQLRQCPMTVVLCPSRFIHDALQRRKSGRGSPTLLSLKIAATDSYGSPGFAFDSSTLTATSSWPKAPCTQSWLTPHGLQANAAGAHRCAAAGI
eukprot:4278686-Pleurochrysis_carterae.AAC.3